LKQKITTQPVLALSKRKGKFRVEVDASEHAIRGVLSQEQEGKWKPVAFLSRTMSPVKRNYKIYDKELLAIVEALDKWRQYLLDVVEKFEVWTDHENLKYFKELHKLNGQQVKWYLKLQDYDFTLWHIPGIRLANSKARIKPTAPLSAFDKENSIEFSLDFLHYLYNYYMVYALFSHTYHVTHHVTSM